MRKKILFIFIIIILNTYSFFCMKIYIANLNIYRGDTKVELTDKEKKASILLYRSIKKRDFEGLLNIEFIKNTIAFSEKTTKSTVDASELCSYLHINYLLYGFIEKTYKYYNAEIRLFENDTKTDKKTLYVKTELGTIEEVIEELADKFVKYMYDILGLSQYHVERKRGFGGIGIYSGVGYWFPIGDWWDVITGIVNFELGFNVIPVTPLVKKRNFSFYMRYGFNVSYSLGINKPAFLTSYFNSISLKIPAEACFEIFFRHVFTVGVGPQLQMDIVYQELLYDDPYTGFQAGFSLFANAGYEYWFTKRKLVGLGLNNIFDITFYDNLFVAYKIQVYNIVRIPIDIEYEKREKGEIRKRFEERKKKRLKRDESEGKVGGEEKEEEKSILKEEELEEGEIIKEDEKEEDVIDEGNLDEENETEEEIENKKDKDNEENIEETEKNENLGDEE